ncbi:MAG: LysR family transcriptional regulator [Kangiellaceae bacterium]|nr:LysR family transcriptional regulator [Kangiellaceae bacterium]
MDKLSNMKAFAVVAQTNNFAHAAKQLGIAPSVVSKRIKDLESDLGALLFQRTTRKISLTEMGYNYLEHCRRILDELEEVEESIRYRTQMAIGEIKLAAPLSFAIKTLGPAVSNFLELYPEVTIKTYLADKQVDLIEEGYDVSIRIGELADSSLIAKKLVDCKRVVCASDTYLSKNGTPQSPSDLIQHNCLSYTNLLEGKNWPFIVNGNKRLQPVQGRFHSDNGDLLSEAVIAGCGISMLPSFIVDAAVNRGDLKVVLQEFESPDFVAYAVYPNRRHLSNRVRLLIEFLVNYFEVN